MHPNDQVHVRTGGLDLPPSLQTRIQEVSRGWVKCSTSQHVKCGGKRQESLGDSLEVIELASEPDHHCPNPSSAIHCLTSSSLTSFCASDASLVKWAAEERQSQNINEMLHAEALE